jgi:hypothetical protein
MLAYVEDTIKKNFYHSFGPNKTQIKSAKFVLGVHKSATNIAVLSELGLFLLSLCTM